MASSVTRYEMVSAGFFFFGGGGGGEVNLARGILGGLVHEMHINMDNNHLH